MKLNGKQILIDREIAFNLIECRKENPLYGEMEVLYEELREELECLIELEGILGYARSPDIFGNGQSLDQEEYAVVLYTLGNKVSEYISDLFEAGEYLKGTLADAMADSCLFTMEEEWKEILLTEFRKQKRGVKMRLEAGKDFPMEAQKRIWELLNGQQYGIGITSGYMFTPVKTCSYVFKLSEDCTQNRMEHECDGCKKMDCKIRKETKK